MKRNKKWIITIWTAEIEPVMTLLFDNQESADSCAQHYEEQGYIAYVDECTKEEYEEGYTDAPYIYLTERK